MEAAKGGKNDALGLWMGNGVRVVIYGCVLGPGDCGDLFSCKTA
jgi:hypothetical protein